jgi:hypothetical protein
MGLIGEDGKCYFSPKKVCEELGITWQGQLEKIKNDQVLASTVKVIVMVANDGKQRKGMVLPREMLPGWLFTIKKVRPELQDRLNRFRLEGFIALDTWFNKGLRGDVKVMV